ncbi:MAG TPA: 3-dehydroquinate synthase [Candidatus Omnitrophota bacterium]|nr:3-dehydroquinate synthase [Candidatus Omnitrophota bacterium]
MKKIKVAIPQRPYYIYIKKGALKDLKTLIKRSSCGKDAIVITTKKLFSLYGEKLKKQLQDSCDSVLFLTIPDSEKSKSASIALNLIQRITLFDKKKSPFCVAFGGGVVGDITGFVAAIYKRGIPYIQVPTTLLAQIDSSIGGKTAVDTECGKNLVGAFYQPKFVLCDIDLLSSLPQSQIAAGLSEAVKYALIKDRSLFDYISKNLKKIKKLQSPYIDLVISKCASIKARAVALDEYDKKGVRIILNFGHTFGHAIEAASNYKVSHGQGVAIGMVCAASLSTKLGILKKGAGSQIEWLLKQIGLPVKIRKIEPSKIFSALAYDKKFRKKNRFVLLENIGKTKIVENVNEVLIKEVLRQETA